MFRPELMAKYPQTKRSGLLDDRSRISHDMRSICKQFGRTYFDSERRFGYGGYHYNPKFFGAVVKDFISHYNLKPGMKVLDVGCAKGFMLKDFIEACPLLEITGVDISIYALMNCVRDIADNLMRASCECLPFNDKSFDLVVSIATIHNVGLNGVRDSLREIQRVGKQAFIKVNGYRNLAEREALERWNLVAETILRDEEWEELFAETGYTGDWDFFRT